MSKIQLSDHFTYRRLLKFVLPSIIMMIFTSIYGVVDGLFVSNFAGKIAFAAVNLILPFPMIVGALGFMLGAGGVAIVSKTMGEGQAELANKYFSMIVITTIVGGVVLSAISQIFLPQLAVLMGATDKMLPLCIQYGRICLLSMPFFMLQNVFQSFFVTAEKPRIGLAVTIIAGCANMFLDFLFVGVFNWGVIGAASATAVSEILGGGIPLFYFIGKNASRLRLHLTNIDWKIIGKASYNGVSELLTNVSMSFVNMLYNFQLLKYAGEDGVAAYGVIMYVAFIFAAVFFGFVVGSSPIVGYNYGAQNHDELHNIYRKSIVVSAVAGFIMTIAAVAMSGPLAVLFTGYDDGLCAMTKLAFGIYSLRFIFMGFNVFGSSFFTALGNGFLSGLISFLRTLVFQTLFVCLLPFIFGLNGIWFAGVISEVASLAVTIFLLIQNKDRYNYGNKDWWRKAVEA